MVGDVIGGVVGGERGGASAPPLPAQSGSLYAAVPVTAAELADAEFAAALAATDLAAMAEDEEKKEGGEGKVGGAGVDSPKALPSLLTRLTRRTGKAPTQLNMGEHLREAMKAAILCEASKVGKKEEGGEETEKKRKGSKESCSYPAIM